MANGAQRIAKKPTSRLSPELEYPFLVPYTMLIEGSFWHDHTPAQWCELHCEGKWTITWHGYRFANQQDRVAFALAWASGS
jgi:hypothetical protein